MAVALATTPWETAWTSLRTTRWASAPPPTLSDSDRFCPPPRLATVAARIQLESRLDPAEIAGLAEAQLDQSGQPVFHRHASRSIFVVGGALLQRPCLLQEAFLGMDQHPPSLPALGCDALGPQWTYSTYRPVELEGLSSGIPAPRHPSAFPLARWCG